MLLKSIRVKNIRAVAELEWDLEHAACGWHVIIGDNGAGKSSLLRAIALALAGPAEAPALRQDWSTWLRSGCDAGRIQVVVVEDAKWDHFARGGAPPKNYHPAARLNLIRDADSVHLVRGKTQLDPTRSIWGTGAGWFSASYGPFRRFAGGDKDQEKLFFSNPRLARHLSVFGESVALCEALEWLKLLHFRDLEGDGASRTLLEHVKTFVNQPDFLPHGAQLTSVSSKGVQFVDGNGFDLAVDSLSDGYRSILSMTFELLRQLCATYGVDRVFEPSGLSVAAPGVVIIDEIDAHLHPTWQLRIGYWFRKHFPKIQFLVTTHSPLVCQAADVGTVFRLARPGSDEPSRMITGTELDRLLYGNILDAYGTGLLGDGVTRSPVAQDKLRRLAELNRKSLAAKLTSAETKERDTLLATFPTEGQGSAA